MTALLDRPASHVADKGGTRVLTREEGRRLLDEKARRYLNMTGEVFVREWRAGTFATDVDRPEVMRVAMLLPLAA